MNRLNVYFGHAYHYGHPCFTGASSASYCILQGHFYGAAHRHNQAAIPINVFGPGATTSWVARARALRVHPLLGAFRAFSSGLECIPLVPACAHPVCSSIGLPIAFGTRYLYLPVHLFSCCRSRRVSTPRFLTNGKRFCAVPLSDSL